MPNEWITDHKWHDIQYHHLPEWVKRRVKELDHHTLTGKSFKYRRQRKSGKYQRRLRYHTPRLVVLVKQKFKWAKRNWGKILVFLGILATIAIILSAVGLSISGDTSLTAGVIISIVGLVILLWSLRMLSKRKPRISGVVMILLISLIFIMLSAAYLDIRSFSDIGDSIVGGFTTEEGEFRENIEAFIERVELTFAEVTEDVIEEIDDYPNTDYVYVDGAILVGADGHYITLKNNPDATNPTWSELKSFLASDDTDKLKYNINTFVCGDFAEMLHNNAEAAGLRAALVFVRLGPCEYYSTSGPHTLNAFQTTDKGLLYIDCTGTIEDYGGSADKIVEVEVGKPYIPEDVFPHGDWYWSSMGVVEEIRTIQW